MAHAGRIYPLAFRRDFCLNRLTYQSMALAYLLPLNTYGGVAGAASSGLQVELKNPTYLSLSDSYRYETDPYAAGPFTIFHSFNWDFVNNGTLQRVQWTVHELTLGVVFQSNFITSNADPDGGFIDLHTVAVETPLVWVRTVNFSQFFAPKPW